MTTEKKLNIALKAAVCVLIALVSIFVLGRLFSTPDTYSGIIASIDEKVSTTLKLTASATAASAGITAIPDDIGTPIAERLADFSEYGFLIVCVLYAEKYLLTILGSAVFLWIIPAVCILYALTFFLHTKRMPTLLIKIAVVSIALFGVIPLSIHISDRIYDTYQVSIDNTISQAEELTEETSLLGDAGESENAIKAVFDFLKTSASGLADKGARLVNRFIESMAVMVVTSCIIPLLVLFFSLWIIKQLLGFDIPLSRPGLTRRSVRQLSGRGPGHPAP